MHQRISLVLVGLSLCLVIASGDSTTPVPSTPAADVGIPAPGGEDVACSDKKPCPDKNSKCTDGRCLCNEGFAPAGNDTCLKSPGVGDSCRKGSVELFCHGFGVDAQCPNNSVCACRTGYESDGKGACKPAVRNVGDACKIHGDCTAAFTNCQSGKCACIEGFKADSKGTLCTPSAFSCLNGMKALEEKGTVRLCELLGFEPGSGDLGNSTCPANYFCNVWGNSQTPTRTIPGHCCPIPPNDKNLTNTCPIGVEHKTGKCLDLSQFPADKPLPPEAGPFCPLGDGYECMHGRWCCPLACRSSNSHFNINGKCYDSVGMDEPCEFDSQCLLSAECKKGTCQCKSDYTKSPSGVCLAPGESEVQNSPSQ